MPMLLGDLLLFFCLAAWVNSFRVGNDLLLSGVFSPDPGHVPGAAAECTRRRC
jgi:hypothetical protein